MIAVKILLQCQSRYEELVQHGVSEFPYKSPSITRSLRHDDTDSRSSRPSSSKSKSDAKEICVHRYVRYKF